MANNRLFLVARTADGTEITRYTLGKRMGDPWGWYSGNPVLDEFWDEANDCIDPKVVSLEFEGGFPGEKDGFTLALDKHDAAIEELERLASALEEDEDGE
jgi:hypothetical protein